jgi:hypothetical protein
MHSCMHTSRGSQFIIIIIIHDLIMHLVATLLYTVDCMSQGHVHSSILDDVHTDSVRLLYLNRPIMHPIMERQASTITLSLAIMQGVAANESFLQWLCCCLAIAWLSTHPTNHPSRQLPILSCALSMR